MRLHDIACRLLRHSALALSVLLPLAAPLAVSAAPVEYFVPYNGSGNLSVFDPAVGNGGWVGSIVQTPPPQVPDPLNLVSVVLFQLDAATQTLTGTFEFTSALDLASSLTGSLIGSYTDADILTEGGQFQIDYLITGGTGSFTGATGFGLAFVDYTPLQQFRNRRSFDNYAEAGLLSFSVPLAVPEPGSLALVLAGLAGVVLLARRTSR